MQATLLLATALTLTQQTDVRANEKTRSPFALRGYYFTFSRMPTFGLDAWKQIIDCIHADGGNTVILWIGGGFKSKKFPETWTYNLDHANVQNDFVHDLIDYAHAKHISILLGFTPFGYDGVNQMSLTRPEWRATGPDGKPATKFGFHSWGYNLCPARADTQQFMLEYIRELVHDFYPNADGLLIESSDYAACHCKDCGARFYDHEFRFVKAISEDVWSRNKDALIIVYPHYFTGAKVPLLGITAARQPFDPRWALFFTPHSAHPDARLIAQARAAIWSDDAPARRDPTAIRDNAQRARREMCNGYIPSLESFTYIPTEPEEGQQYLVGKRRVPFGFGWLKPGQQPYNELPIRINRIAFREYTRSPDLSDADFRTILGKELFGDAASPQAIADALALREIFALDRTWCQPSPCVSPERLREMNAAGQLTDLKRNEYRATLDRLHDLERRYRNQPDPFAEIHRIANWATNQWAGGDDLLSPKTK